MSEDPNEEAHDDPEEDDAPEEGGGKRKRKRLLIVAGAVLATIVVGAGAFFAGLFGSAPGDEVPADAVEETADEMPAEPPPKIAYYDLPNMQVDLIADGGRARTVSITVSLELMNDTDLLAVRALGDDLVDDLNTYMRALRPRDLEGSPAYHRLREELLLRANRITDRVRIRDVHILQLVTQ